MFCRGEMHVVAAEQQLVAADMQVGGERSALHKVLHMTGFCRLVQPRPEPSNRLTSCCRPSVKAHVHMAQQCCMLEE